MLCNNLLFTGKLWRVVLRAQQVSVADEHTYSRSLPHLWSIASLCGSSVSTFFSTTLSSNGNQHLLCICDVYLQGSHSTTWSHKPPTCMFAPVEIHICCFCRLSFHKTIWFLCQSPEEGAVSPIYCAVAEETEGITGKYFDSDCSLVLPAPLARDTALAVKDFEICERLTSKLWNDSPVNGGLIKEKGSNSSLGSEHMLNEWRNSAIKWKAVFILQRRELTLFLRYNINELCLNIFVIYIIISLCILDTGFLKDD